MEREAVQIRTRSVGPDHLGVVEAASGDGTTAVHQSEIAVRAELRRHIDG